MLRGAARAECGTLERLLQPAENLAADAFAGGRGLLRAEAEFRGRIERGEFLPEGPPACRDRAEPPPVAVDDAEHLADDSEGRGIAAGAHDARVGVLDVGPAGLELADAPEQPLEDVHRLKSGHDD